MAVRYSAARLESSVRTRLTCLVAMDQITQAQADACAKGTPIASALPEVWDHHEAQAQSGALGFPKHAEDVPGLRKKPRTDPGQGRDASLKQASNQAERPGQQDQSDQEKDDTSGESTASRSASSTSGSAAEAEEDSDTDPVEDVYWLLPEGYQTRVHASRGERAADGRLIPLCRHTPFSWATDQGRGLAGAKATGRRMRALCWTRSCMEVGDNLTD